MLSWQSIGKQENRHVKTRIVAQDKEAAYRLTAVSREESQEDQNEKQK
jgi:hypothetical protein